jgi:hypothetical protein
MCEIFFPRTSDPFIDQSSDFSYDNYECTKSQGRLTRNLDLLYIKSVVWSLDESLMQ